MVLTVARTILMTAFLAMAVVTAGACSKRDVPTAAAAQPQTAVIPVEGMSCGSCAARLKRKLVEAPGVTSVEVNLAERVARVTFDAARTQPTRLIEVIDANGFKAGPPKVATP